MAHPIQLTVDWREASRDLPEAQQEALTQTLMKELRQVDAVEMVERVPEGASHFCSEYKYLDLESLPFSYAKSNHPNV